MATKRRVRWGYWIVGIHAEDFDEVRGVMSEHGWHPFGYHRVDPPEIGDNPTLEQLVASISPPSYVVVFRRDDLKWPLGGPLTTPNP